MCLAVPAVEMPRPRRNHHGSSRPSSCSTERQDRRGCQVEHHHHHHHHHHHLITAVVRAPHSTFFSFCFCFFILLLCCQIYLSLTIRPVDEDEGPYLCPEHFTNNIIASRLLSYALLQVADH